METLKVSLSPRPGSPPPAPPVNVADLPLGFDIYEGNGSGTETVADFQALKAAGRIFGLHKVAQKDLDGKFDARYPMLRDAGLIRGSYDFFAPIDVNAQVDLVVNHVQRLTPGDLAPAIDLEDGSKQLNVKYNYLAGMAGRQNLFNDVATWLNEVEKQLGRIPIVYTGVIWREQFNTANFPNLPDMNSYPLLTAHPSPYNVSASLTGEVLAGWSTYSIWQYAEDKSHSKIDPNNPRKLWGVDPYVEPGTERFDGIDYDAFNGTIYGLRGLADIGRPGVALDGTDPYVAHSEVDGHLHLLARPSNWTDSNLSAGNLPNGGEDPVLHCSAGSLFLYFRADGHLMEASLGKGTAWKWNVSQIEDARPVHDPRVFFDGDKRYAVYWGEDDDWYLMTYDAGAWSSSGGILHAANLGRSTGQPTLYVTQGVVHVVGRMDLDGDLQDLSRDASGTWKHDNVSALARALAPGLPAATYSPSAYETTSGVGIVFRAVGGHLWVVTRSDNAATDLTATTQGPLALGHPDSFVLQDKPHIVFRGMDNLIHEMWLEGGSWHLQQVCTATAASEPVATTNGTIALVAVRGTDGMIDTAQFDGSGWTCNSTTMATIVQPDGTVPWSASDSASASADSATDSGDSALADNSESTDPGDSDATSTS
jgi:GH25 family lysozyme M1 (1,4-beta-N-acetylmuramidase)